VDDQIKKRTYPWFTLWTIGTTHVAIVSHLVNAAKWNYLLPLQQQENNALFTISRNCFLTLLWQAKYSENFGAVFLKTSIFELLLSTSALLSISGFEVWLDIRDVIFILCVVWEYITSKIFDWTSWYLASAYIKLFHEVEIQSQLKTLIKTQFIFNFRKFPGESYATYLT